MSTYFTIWHWVAVVFFIFIFLVLTFLSFQDKNSKNRLSMIFASLLVTITAGSFVVMSIDKYTKKAVLYGVENRRILRNESIVFSGYVKNIGEYKIGKIFFTVKLVNKGHVTGNVRSGSFFNPSGIIDFFTSLGENRKYKPQKVEETFVVAQDLQPDKAKNFRVKLKFPPYFKKVSAFTSITAH